MSPEEGKRTDKIRIRCKPKTRIAFNTFVAENDFKYKEDAIESLLGMAQENPRLFKKSKIRYV